VHHRWGVDELSGPARAAVREPLRELCAAHGLAGLPDPTVLLDPCPPSLQLPDVEVGTPIRYVPFNGAAERPAWVTGPVPDGVKRVAVSMGGRTLFLNGVPHVRRILRAFDGMAGVEVLATVEESYRAALGPLPANVRLIDPTPLDLWLGGCDAMVHHGGAGSAMAATALGLPQLVLPQLADQFGHGDRLAAVGAAVTLDTAETQDDPALLRDAAEAVVFEPGYRKAAGELAREIAAMPAPSQVAADLEELATGRREAG
jgi:UDP:flavonoid glycosyltransferase YjiC (YdhE family)